MSAATISRRPVPGTGRTVSAIGIVLDAALLRSPDAAEGLPRLLRRARSGGVTTLELPSGAGTEVLERAIATAFPEPDPELTILSERSSEGPPASAPGAGAARGRSSAPTGSIRDALEGSDRRLRPQRIHLVDWVAREGDAPSLAAELAALRADATVEGIVRRVGPSTPASGEAPSDRTGNLWSAELSLLDDRRVRRLDALAQRPDFGLFARDPFDAGRLDGRRLTDTVGPRRPGSGPVRLRELEQEFAPVLALGYLTEGRRRTLTQAAIQYALGWPGVCCVLVPLPPPERLDEVLAAESTPPLSEEELARLAVATGRGSEVARDG